MTTIMTPEQVDNWNQIVLAAIDAGGFELGMDFWVSMLITPAEESNPECGTLPCVLDKIVKTIKEHDDVWDLASAGYYDPTPATQEDVNRAYLENCPNKHCPVCVYLRGI